MPVPFYSEHVRGHSIKPKWGMIDTVVRVPDIIYFYRIVNWREKISCLRPLAYTFLGYLLAPGFRIGAAARNTLVVAAILTASYALNDYYDFQLNGEGSYLTRLIRVGRIDRKAALLWCWLPLILVILLPIANTAAVILTLTLIVLTLLYSIPPVRLKSRRVWGFVTPPACAVIMLLQSYALFAPIGLTIAALALLVLLFHLYVETIHQISDSVAEGAGKDRVGAYLSLLKLWPTLSLVVSAVLSLFQPVFLISTGFAVVRLIALKRVDVPQEISKIRKNILTPIWSIYEFLAYGLIGFFRLIEF